MVSVNLNWPLVVTQVAFNIGGNDTSAAPIWTDLSARVRAWDCSAGRQYEIDQNQTGEATATLSDKDEALNPANTASPYYPGVLPYREILQQAMWPPAAVGAAVNLWGVSGGFDPDHELTAVGLTPPGILGFNTVPIVSTSTPRNGVHSLTWTTVSGGGAQYTGITFSAIPGRQYTASVYVRQSLAGTFVSFLNGGGSGTSTTTTGAYVRLTLTFTATQPTHQFYIGHAAPSTASVILVDQWQLNEGATALTWANDGPVIYGVFDGFVERWPKSWSHQGLYGMCQIVCVDALGVLANTKLKTEAANALLATGPLYLWRLHEGSGSTTFGDTSGHAGPPLVMTDSKYGPAVSADAGTSSPCPGNPGLTAVSMFTPAAFPQPATVVQCGAQYNPAKTQQLTGIGGTPPFGLSVAVTATRTAVGPDNGRMLMLTRGDYNQRLVEIVVDTTPAVSMLAGPASGFSVGFSAPDVWADGKAHQYVVTVACDATNYVLTGYVDGVNIGTTTLVTSAFDSPFSGTQIQVGGLIADVVTGDWAGEVNRGVEGGVYEDVAIWARALTAAEAATLAQGAAGYPGENSGARVARYLGYSFTGSYGAQVGQSTMGVSNLAERTATLDACQNVTATENGNFFANSAGTVLFTSRTARYLTLAARYVLGELENPYEQGITFDFDPTRIANLIKITRTGGITAVAEDAASQTAYFEREFDREINVQDDGEATDAATWLLMVMKDPYVRVASIVLNPAANPALWPVTLAIGIGDRVTVKRRAISGGLTMSLDFFVEKVSRSHAAGKFTVTLQLSPVLTASKTPWILEDPAFGLLGSTTILGY